MLDLSFVIESRSIKHLMGRLIFLIARSDNRSMDFHSLMRHCEHRLADDYGSVLVLKVVRFDRAAGISKDTWLESVPQMHFAQRPLNGEIALVVFAIATTVRTASLPNLPTYGRNGRALAVAGKIAGTTWIGASASSAIVDDAMDAYSSLFHEANAALKICGSSYSSLVRTWTSYAGSGAPGENTIGNEFQLFNRARKAFYEQCFPVQLGDNPYCANTGLRDWSSIAAMAGIGVHASDGRLRRIEIGNPVQAPPSSYGSTLSVAQPLFSRGYATDDGESVLVWVSGVVAVRGSSVSSLEAEEQIVTVLANLEALLSTKNLSAHGIPEQQLQTRFFPYAFVSLRDLSYASLVREKLERLLGCETMLLFTQTSGFALPNLHVEIDCVAYFTNSGDTR
jgi:hypothetical protein